MIDFDVLCHFPVSTVEVTLVSKIYVDDLFTLCWHKWKVEWKSKPKQPGKQTINQTNKQTKPQKLAGTSLKIFNIEHIDRFLGFMFGNYFKNPFL